MTPKEEAKELVDKFTVVGLQQRDEGIECALICVEKMQEEVNKFKGYMSRKRVVELERVKQEIINYGTKNI
jgi:hypothetical protein